MLVADSMFYSSARALLEDRVIVALSKCWALLYRSLDDGSEAASLKRSRSRRIFFSKSAMPTLSDVMADVAEIHRLVPSAQSEPAQAGIEFPHALFVELGSCLQTISLQLGTLDLVFSDQHRSLKSLFEDSPEAEQTLKQLSTLLEKRLSDSAVLLSDLFDRNHQPAELVEAYGESDSDAAQLRSDILEKRYSVHSATSSTSKGNARSISTGSIRSRNKDGPQLKDLFSCCLSRKGSARVAAMPMSPIAGSADDMEQTFLQLLEDLRALAARHTRGELPSSDRLSQVELIIYLLQNIDSQLQIMNAAIAEQG